MRVGIKGGGVVKVEVELGDLERNIAEKIADVEGKIRRKAGKNAGHQLAEALSENTPKLPLPGKTMLSQTVTVGAVREDGTVDVGYGRGGYYRAHIVNMGSEFQSGQHFVEKTVETEIETVMKSYMNDLKEGLGL